MAASSFDEHQGILYVGYGQLMRSFQFLEMNLWAIQALHLKPGVQLHQAFAKVEAWDSSVTYGAMVNQVAALPGWPADLLERLKSSVPLRNYLAHRFLREFFIAKESSDNYENVFNSLLTWTELVDDLDADVEAHLTSLNGGEIDPELAAELAGFQPTTWPLKPPAAAQEKA